MVTKTKVLELSNTLVRDMFEMVLWAFNRSSCLHVHHMSIERFDLMFLSLKSSWLNEPRDPLSVLFSTPTRLPYGYFPVLLIRCVDKRHWTQSNGSYTDIAKPHACSPLHWREIATGQSRGCASKALTICRAVRWDLGSCSVLLYCLRYCFLNQWKKSKLFSTDVSFFI